MALSFSVVRFEIISPPWLAFPYSLRLRPVHELNLSGTESELEEMAEKA